MVDIGQLELEIPKYEKQIRKQIELLMKKDLEAGKYLLSIVKLGVAEKIKTEQFKHYLRLEGVLQRDEDED